VAEIVADSGTHFDPSLVEAFMTLDHAMLAGPLETSDLAAFPTAEDGEDAVDTASRRRRSWIRARDQRAG
jgi:hypothetical protein